MAILENFSETPELAWITYRASKTKCSHVGREVISILSLTQRRRGTSERSAAPRSIGLAIASDFPTEQQVQNTLFSLKTSR